MPKVGLLAILISAIACAFYIGRVHPSRTIVASKRIVYYVDPMHPSYHSATPGIAPDCGMPLVPVYAEDLAQAAASASNLHPGAAFADETSRQLYGIQLTTVEPASAHGTLHFYGRVAADPTRIFHVDIGSEGYVKETHDDAVGDRVRKDQHLATVYSPDFLALAGGFLSAAEREPGAPMQQPRENPSQALNASGARARADRLRNAGMSDVQIEEMRTTQKLPEDVYVVSPVDGLILSRTISPGMRFERHTEFYTVADLSRVWVLADAFGGDASAFRPGAVAQITLPDTGQHFTARVSSVLPEVDTTSHALQPRLEVANSGFQLRPGMFVDITISSPGRDGLTVPEEAIVSTGRSKEVFVEVTKDTFAAREIQTGSTLGNRVQVLKGLQEGDRIVSSGTFLIDSEARMRRNTFEN